MTKRKRSDNVVTIHGAVLDRAKANADVVSVLRKELERARSGDVVGIAIVRAHADGATSFVQ